MKTLFYSIKGGQGKTTLAINYTKHKDALYLTNDYLSGTVEIYKDMFGENQLQIIKPDTTLNLKKLKEDFKNIVFDFGGWADEKIKMISMAVDAIIIPICYQSVADILPCIKTVNSIYKFNEHIIIVINNTDPKDIKEVKEYLIEKLPVLPILIVNKSKYMNRLANDSKTVFDLFEEGGIVRYSLNKTGLMGQISSLFNQIERG